MLSWRCSSSRVSGVELPRVATELDKALEPSVEEIHRALEHSATSSSSRARSVTVCVSLCEEKIRRTWYSKTVEEQPWERYEITFSMASGQTERGTLHAS